jgi:hypothetical protein
MLKQKIQEHNYLNGYLFVIIEFSIFIIVLLPFTWYYLLHEKLWLGIIGLGLITNFIPVILYALRSFFRKEKSIGIIKFYNKKQRDDIREKIPNLSRDTSILFAYLIVPFLLITTLFIEQQIFKRRA